MSHLVFYRVRRIRLAIWNALANAQRAILIGTSCFIVLLLFGSVLMRYIIHYPGMEVEEIATLVAFWLYFTGAVYGSYERSHIKAELVHLIVKKPRAYAAVKVTASLIVFVLALIMTYWGYHFFLWGIEKWGRSAVLLLPMV
ncbi:MAG: TRAP transporter small permease, partial [Dehalococcoidales bacterium]